MLHFFAAHFFAVSSSLPALLAAAELPAAEFKLGRVPSNQTATLVMKGGRL